MLSDAHAAAAAIEPKHEAGLLGRASAADRAVITMHPFLFVPGDRDVPRIPDERTVGEDPLVLEIGRQQHARHRPPLALQASLVASSVGCFEAGLAASAFVAAGFFAAAFFAAGLFGPAFLPAAFFAGA